MAADAALEGALSKVSELFLPGFLEGPVKSAFRKCESKVGEVFDEIIKLFIERGSATALRAAGQSWNEQVGYHASTQAGLLVKEALVSRSLSVPTSP